MFIYLATISIVDTKFTDELLSILPAMELSVGSEIELSDLCLMQFIRKATSDLFSNLVGIKINPTEGQLHWNKYTGAEFDETLNNFPIIVEFLEFNQVKEPSSWHIQANPLDLLSSVYFTSTTADGVLPDYDDQIWFDCYLPNIMTKSSTGDFDNEVRASGLVVYNRMTGDINITVTDEFMTCQSIFDFNASKLYFASLLRWLFNYKGFRHLDISSEEILEKINQSSSLSVV